jgi:hypothetical protein
VSTHFVDHFILFLIEQQKLNTLLLDLATICLEPAKHKIEFLLMEMSVHFIGLFVYSSNEADLQETRPVFPDTR